MIEFDIPGHSSFGYAFPEIVGCPHFYDDEYIYQKQSVALDPTVDKTYQVLFNLFKEFETVFPDAYFHLGGLFFSSSSFFHFFFFSFFLFFLFFFFFFFLFSI